MSETWKDSASKSTHQIVLKVTKNDDGTYEIILNDEVVGRRIPETWLDNGLCGKRGFCGKELTEIKRQLHECGQAALTL